MRGRVEHVGTWCSGITPAQHAGGPGFNPQCVHFLPLPGLLIDACGPLAAPTPREVARARDSGGRDARVELGARPPRRASRPQAGPIGAAEHRWVHSSVVRAADCRSAGPWLKSGCALLRALSPAARRGALAAALARVSGRWGANSAPRSRAPPRQLDRRSWWLLSCTEAPPVPFRRALPSLLAVPSLACSVASLSLCPGGYLPDQRPLQSTGLAGCQIAWDTSSTWSGKHAQELQLLHLLVHSDRCQLDWPCASTSVARRPQVQVPRRAPSARARVAGGLAGCQIAGGTPRNCNGAAHCLRSAPAAAAASAGNRIGEGTAQTPSPRDARMARLRARRSQHVLGLRPPPPSLWEHFSTSYMAAVPW
jgi:hypothetical protein